MVFVYFCQPIEDVFYRVKGAHAHGSCSGGHLCVVDQRVFKRIFFYYLSLALCGAMGIVVHVSGLEIVSEYEPIFNDLVTQSCFDSEPPDAFEQRSDVVLIMAPIILCSTVVFIFIFLYGGLSATSSNDIIRGCTMAEDSVELTCEWAVNQEIASIYM